MKIIATQKWFSAFEKAKSKIKVKVKVKVKEHPMVVLDTQYGSPDWVRIFEQTFPKQSLDDDFKDFDSIIEQPELSMEEAYQLDQATLLSNGVTILEGVTNNVQYRGHRYVGLKHIPTHCGMIDRDDGSKKVNRKNYLFT